MPIKIILMLVAAYIGVCALIGVLGRRKKMGAWGYFFGSMLLTPIIGMLLLSVSGSRSPER